MSASTPKAGRLDAATAEAKAKAKAVRVRTVVGADGSVWRAAGHARFDGEPRRHSCESGLSRPAAIAGRATDDGYVPSCVYERMENVNTASVWRD